MGEFHQAAHAYDGDSIGEDENSLQLSTHSSSP